MLLSYTNLERDKWIAEAAYYRAEKRGFRPGFALEDWLEAEALVAFQLRQSGLVPSRDESREGKLHTP